MQVVPGPDKRVHARIPQQWAGGAFTDFWIHAGGADDVTAAAAGEPGGLDGFGWVITSLVFTNAVTGDFLSAADDTPANYNSDASGDKLTSPIIFGNYAHAKMVASMLGYQPATLNVEFYGAFTTNTANETATHIGLNNGSAAVMAVYSDGTNFKLYNGSASSSAGAAKDTAYHTWKISITGATASWYIDGTLQNTLAIVNDVWPASFTAVASTTNRFALAWAHVWYE